MTVLNKDSSATHLCLSPLTINSTIKNKLFISGKGCIDQKTFTLLREHHIEYEIVDTRSLTKDEYFNIC